MSAAQAEPPPERNHDLPSMDDMLPPEIVEEFLEFGHAGASFATGSLAAGVYGLPPGMRPRSQRVRGTPYQRPDTGYVIRFPVEPTGRWGDGGNAGADEIAQGAAAQEQGAAGDFMGGLQVQVQAIDALTFSSMGAMPAEVVDALLNVPHVPLGEWHRMRARHRSGQNARAAPRTPRNSRPVARRSRR